MKYFKKISTQITTINKPKVIATDKGINVKSRTTPRTKIDKIETKLNTNKLAIPGYAPIKDNA
jgi:hypothetical protein